MKDSIKECCKKYRCKCEKDDQGNCLCTCEECKDTTCKCTCDKDGNCVCTCDCKECKDENCCNGETKFTITAEEIKEGIFSNCCDTTSCC